MEKKSNHLLQKHKKQCLLCGSEDLIYITENSIFKRGLYKCENCNLFQLYPLMNKEELNLFYRSGYYPKHDGRVITKRYIARREKRVKNLFKYIKPYLKKEGKALEIGCAEGLFLKEVKNFGWDVLGVEPDPVTAKFAISNNIDVKIKIFDSNDYMINSFDLVALFMVLEHVWNPLEFLKEVRRVIKPGGLIFIEVPNILNGYENAIMHQVPHISHFNFNNLKMLLKDANYEIVSARKTGRKSLSIKDFLHQASRKITGRGRPNYLNIEVVKENIANCQKQRALTVRGKPKSTFKSFSPLINKIYEALNYRFSQHYEKLPKFGLEVDEPVWLQIIGKK